MHRLLLLVLLTLSSRTFAEAVRSVAIDPQGASVASGSAVPFHVTCSYADGSKDDCHRAGGAKWSSSRTHALAVGSSGLAVWRGSPKPPDVEVGYVIVTAGGMTDRAQVLAQKPGDLWTQYMTPDTRRYHDASTGLQQPLAVVVGATVTIGSGIVVDNVGPATGLPYQGACTWSSSDTAVATIDRHGQLRARSPGKTTVTCGRAGSAKFASSTIAAWTAPGNTIEITVVAGGSGSSTWYVRPDGGSPFVTAATTPLGQCDGRHDAPYPGRGVNRPCAVGSLKDLWLDRTTPNSLRWRIAGGDTVLVAQNPGGYRMNLDAPGAYQKPVGGSWLPVNCQTNTDCTMPTIPSGTAARHTRILGTNFGSCQTDAAKTKLFVSFSGQAAFNLTDSQFVDVGCFDISDRADCAYNGNYTHKCNGVDTDFGKTGIQQSALTSEVHLTDIFIHGLAGTAIHGATGVGVVADRIHIRGVPDAGIDMDDSPWDSGNISVAGGLTLRGSMTEFAGCVEEFPVRHQFPLIECRDQETGGYGDGFGTGSTTGDWVFDRDIWRYNFQDGLDLLHSGMQHLTVTNSQGIGNDGQAFKVGASDTVTFRNNLVIGNCNRISFPIGDEPLSAIVPGINPCRAGGGWVAMQFTDQGSYTVENGSYAGYGATPFGMECAEGWDDCSHASTTFRNNVVLGYVNPLYNNGQPPALFYRVSSHMPPHQGWAVRDHNLFFNVRFRYCPWPLQTGETCNTEDPLFVGQPRSPIAAEMDLDDLSFVPSGESPLIAAGAPGADQPVDLAGTARPSPPAIGAFEPAEEDSPARASQAGSPGRLRRRASLRPLLTLLWQDRPNLLRLRYLALLLLLVAAGAALVRRRGK